MLTTKEQPTQERNPVDLFDGDKKIGDAKQAKHNAGDWHVCINVNTGPTSPSYTLIQGFAATIDDAVTAAIRDGIKHHEAAIAAIRKLEASLQK